MAEEVVRALYGGSTSLNLSSKKVREVPQCVSRLSNLSVLLLNNNCITALPVELLSLQQVSPPAHAMPHRNTTFNVLDTFFNYVFIFRNACKLEELNLGNNALKEVPAVLGHLESLKKLYLYSNQITLVPPEVLGRSSYSSPLTTCLMYFNLIFLYNAKEHNSILIIYLTDGLQNLVVLNLNHNQIQRLPPEIKRYI